MPCFYDLWLLFLWFCNGAFEQGNLKIRHYRNTVSPDSCIWACVGKYGHVRFSCCITYMSTVFQASIAIHIGLLVLEDLPLGLILTGLVTNAVYLLLLQTFPYIEMTSPVLIVSVGKFDPMERWGTMSRTLGSQLTGLESESCTDLGNFVHTMLLQFTVPGCR